jgi:hypothetical protein
MRFRLRSSIVAIGSLVLVAAAFAQSTTTPPPVAPAPNADTVPVAMSSRLACQASSQKFTGQDKRDQMQLCMVQAHLDCLKQAIDQKIVGPQRKDFLKSCTGQP